MFYKNNFLILSISLKVFIIFTSFSFNSLVIFTINLINFIFFDTINLIINLFFIIIFMSVEIIKLKNVEIMLSEELSSNKKTYIKNAINKFDFFVRK